MSRTYSRKLTPSTADLALIWDQENSDYRLTPLSAVKELFSTDTDVLNEPDSQYEAPLTGATVTITDNGNDIHLIITPVGTLAALTLTLPVNLRDKQTVLVNSTQELTALTVSGGAASVNGAPTTLAANGFFKLKYDEIVNSWYRVG